LLLLQFACQNKREKIQKKNSLKAGGLLKGVWVRPQCKEMVVDGGCMRFRLCFWFEWLEKNV
jgi:hypothetical protein